MQQLFLHDSIMVLIGGARRRIKQVAWDWLKPFGVTPQQAGVLVVLGTEGSVPLRELSSRIWCDNPTACRIINKLVERGLISSRPNIEDRRRYILRLTPAGQSLARELITLSNHLACAVEAGLTKEESDTLRHLLRRVTENMAKSDSSKDTAALPEVQRKQAKA